MVPFGSLNIPSPAILWRSVKGGGMASRSREYTRAAADPTGRFRPPLTDEQKARIAEQEESLRQMRNLRYSHDTTPPALSMRRGSDMLPLFWLGYAGLALLFFGVLWVLSGG
jgi:hypothetical protein